MRSLRIVRVIRFLPHLRVVVADIGRSVPGWVLFDQHDPEHMLTLGNLPDNIEMGRQISDWTIVFFVSYTLLASVLIFNLFIGIVLSTMEEARSADRAQHETDDLLVRLREARTALEDAERELQRTHRDDRSDR